MDRLAEQVVAWHNRHPLAKRISIYDVHTIGVVALPFMRGGRPPLPAEPVEPMLMETVDAALEKPYVAPPPAPEPSLARQALTLVLSRLGLAREPDQPWPLFSERFINRLSPRRVARFALRFGHGNPPGEADWPQRVVAIDERLMARGAAQSAGAWPYELYLMSAGIDAGASRTRVLLAYGPGGRIQVLGSRCLNPLPLALLGGLGLALLLGLGWWRYAGSRDEANAAAASAAEAAASAASAASASAAASAVLPAPTASAAEAAASSMPMTAASDAAPEAASAPEAGASDTAQAPASAPDIRPRLVVPLPARPQFGAGVGNSASAPAAAPPPPTPASKAAPTAPEAGKHTPTATPAAETGSKAQDLSSVLERPEASRAAAAGGKQVALVGPASASKAEAQAMLERMRGLLGQTVRDPDALQAQVFQTHEGWRAAIWPFGSREEAQLINATLIARGLKTKAVDF